MKYLNELFVPYDSFFKTTILLTSMPSILDSFLGFFVKVTLVDLSIIKIYVLSPHYYTWQQRKCEKVFIII